MMRDKNSVAVASPPPLLQLYNGYLGKYEGAGGEGERDADFPGSV